MIANKKILHVVSVSFSLPYFIGDQFNYFHSKGYEIHVACSPSEHLNEYSREKDFKIIEVDILRNFSVLKDIAAVYKLYRYIKSNKIEIVIAHTPKGGLIGMLSAYLANVNVRIYFRHGLVYETSKGFKKFILINVERLSGYLAQKVVCVSKSIYQISNQNNLSRITKNVILANGSCNGIDTTIRFNPIKIKSDIINNLRTELGFEQSDLVLGFVGRVSNDKGIIELIESWKVLNIKYPKVKLLIIGPFDERDRIDPQYVEFIHNTPSVRHIDFLQDTSHYYAIMDIFVLLSKREGLPTVILEASSMKIPVVTTETTGCIDSIIENVTGLFTSFEIDKIVEKLSLYVEDKKLRDEHGNNGRDFVVESFQQISVWNAIKDLIESRS